VKVLVVDDDEAIRDMLTSVLGDEGYKVVSAAGGDEALALAPGERPDVVLVDLMMPGMDGRTLVTRLLKLPELAATPMIMMSAALRVFGQHPGVVDFVPKPFDVDRLLAALERAIAERSGS
jgi:CheY-like chemotaxis protein